MESEREREEGEREREKERMNNNLEYCKNVKPPNISARKMLNIFESKNLGIFRGCPFSLFQRFFLSSQTPLKGFLERGPKIFCSSH